jgi:acyl-CoA thioesterase YciA
MNDKNTELPKGKIPAIRVAAMPSDANAYGSIFGGWIMSQVDIAGSVAATERAQGRVATVAVNSFEFHHPVFVGDLISCYADIIRVGRTSITVRVEVFAQRDRAGLETIKVTKAELTYVALDKDRNPRTLPPEM